MMYPHHFPQRSPRREDRLRRSLIRKKIERDGAAGFQDICDEAAEAFAELQNRTDDAEPLTEGEATTESRSYSVGFSRTVSFSSGSFQSEE